MDDLTSQTANVPFLDIAVSGQILKFFQIFFVDLWAQNNIETTREHFFSKIILGVACKWLIKLYNR